MMPASRVHAGVLGVDVYGNTVCGHARVAGAALVPTVSTPVSGLEYTCVGNCNSSTYTRTGVPGTAPNEFVRSSSKLVG